MNPNSDRYFQGTPCHRGHVGLRYLSTGACVDCMAMHGKNNRAKKSQQRKEAVCDSLAP
jgi:hypothetical protein